MAPVPASLPTLLFRNPCPPLIGARVFSPARALQPAFFLKQRGREREGFTSACREGTVRERALGRGGRHARMKESSQTATAQLWLEGIRREIEKKKLFRPPLPLCFSLLSHSLSLSLSLTPAPFRDLPENHDAPTPAAASLRLPGPPPPQAELVCQRLRRLLRRRFGRRRRRRKREQRRRRQGLGVFFLFGSSIATTHPSPSLLPLSHLKHFLILKSSTEEAASRGRPRRWLRAQPGTEMMMKTRGGWTGR